MSVVICYATGIEIVINDGATDQRFNLAHPLADMDIIRLTYEAQKYANKANAHLISGAILAMLTHYGALVTHSKEDKLFANRALTLQAKSPQQLLITLQRLISNTDKLATNLRNQDKYPKFTLETSREFNPTLDKHQPLFSDCFNTWLNRVLPLTQSELLRSTKDVLTHNIELDLQCTVDIEFGLSEEQQFDAIALRVQDNAERMARVRTLAKQIITLRRGLKYLVISVGVLTHNQFTQMNTQVTNQAPVPAYMNKALAHIYACAKRERSPTKAQKILVVHAGLRAFIMRVESEQDIGNASDQMPTKQPVSLMGLLAARKNKNNTEAKD